MSSLQKKLDEGKFVVTAEIGPPKSAVEDSIIEKAKMLKEHIDAANVTDNQRGVVRMCSLAGCHLLVHSGVEPVMQMTCRDRNRIAIQSDILGAGALDIPNILIVTGDHVLLGDHPMAKSVYDLDSIQTIQMIKLMRDEGVDFAGNELKSPPNLYIGATANPYADPYELQILRLEKKVEVGAQFIQSQAVYDLERFEQFLDDVQYLDVKILAGIVPLKSDGYARFMNKRIPGIRIPQDMIDRLTKAKDKEQEGIQMAIETCIELKKMKRVDGIHIMAIFWEEIVPEIVQGAKLR